ncbi:MAG: hypothetical protein II391_04845, partial [Kiritimatiellae bacterium]|nr:hypothetical protein [Kiritimatiellia bacterium]
MNKIIAKKQLSDNVFRMEVEAPLIAEERKPGQFVILMVDEELGERIPPHDRRRRPRTRDDHPHFPDGRRDHHEALAHER